jgi:hypothetical protein
MDALRALQGDELRPTHHGRRLSGQVARWLLDRLRELSCALYDGGPFAPRDGGLIFRALSETCGWIEADIAALARRAGYWPWDFDAIERAVGAPSPPVPVEVLDDVERASLALAA